MVLSEGTTGKKFQVTPPGIDTGTVRLVAQRLNPYATLGPSTRQNGDTKLQTQDPQILGATTQMLFAPAPCATVICDRYSV
jgi:hypothetical protein